MPKRSEAAPTPRKGINTRITDDLREQLEAAAETSGRSLGAEIEHRLLASFAAQPATVEDVRLMLRGEIHAALRDEHGADPLLHATHCHTGAPRRLDFERRLSGSDIPLTGPEREAFLDGMEAIGGHFGSAPEHT